MKMIPAALAALSLASAAPALAQTASVEAPARPPLIVVVVVDQFSTQLFNEYRGRFTGGLRTLTDQGRVYANGYQTHGVTVTCAGHATVATGLHPARNGIPSNDWLDTATGRQTYCLAAPDNHLAHGNDADDNGPVGPGRMTATALGDWIKAADPAARVFAVSGKDRGAITLNGQTGDGAYWFTGTYGLTTYVEPGQAAEARLAPVADFNRAFQAQARGDNGSAALWTGAYPQCQALASDLDIADFTFHSRVPPERPKFADSPALDEETLAAALHLLDTQGLGRRGRTDVLGVSLSGTDRIGHAFGNQGPEMCEQLMRLDAALGRFMDRLPAGAVLALSADHGGADIPERMAARGSREAGRLDLAILARVNAPLMARFGLSAPPILPSGSGFAVVDGERRALAEPLRSQVLAAALDILKAEPDIAFVAARDELLAEPLPDSTDPQVLTIRERMRLSAVAERSSDIIGALRWGVTWPARQGGTLANHGSPWDYDRGVPVVFWRAGARDAGQERFWPIRTIDIAPTLAAVAGVAAPQDLDGRCLELGYADRDVCPAP